MFSKRDLFKGAAAGLASAMPQLAQGASFGEIAPGPFKPDWDSLTAGYKAPDWFRDAKFGIWAHWRAMRTRSGRLVCAPDVYPGPQAI
jgi:alpha-L-fucosidase